MKEYTIIFNRSSLVWPDCYVHSLTVFAKIFQTEEPINLVCKLEIYCSGAYDD